LKKSNPQNINLQNTSPKIKHVSIKTSPKASNPQVLKKRNSTKKQAQISGKIARLATLALFRLHCYRIRVGLGIP